MIKKEIIIFLSLCVIFISCVRKPANVKITKTADDIRKELEENKGANENASSSSIEEGPKGVSEASQEQPEEQKMVPVASPAAAPVSTDTPAAGAASLTDIPAVVSKDTPVVEATESLVAPSFPLDSFDFCAFPDSLQTAVFQQVTEILGLTTAETDCTVITLIHLAGIKKLDIKNIVSGEKVLLDRERQVYSSHPEELDEKYGVYFSTLEELDLSDNPGMMSIPDFVFHIPNLKKLDISVTGVHEFDKNLCQGQNLVILLSGYNGENTPVTVSCESESDSEDNADGELKGKTSE